MTATTVPAPTPQAEPVSLTTALIARISDRVSAATSHVAIEVRDQVPVLDWFPSLFEAPDDHRANYELGFILSCIEFVMTFSDDQGRALLGEVRSDALELWRRSNLRRELVAYAA